MPSVRRLMASSQARLQRCKACMYRGGCYYLLHRHIHTGLILTQDFKLILRQPLNILTLFL